jgi:hypothetical protein
MSACGFAWSAWRPPISAMAEAIVMAVNAASFRESCDMIYRILVGGDVTIRTLRNPNKRAVLSPHMSAAHSVKPITRLVNISSTAATFCLALYRLQRSAECRHQSGEFRADEWHRAARLAVDCSTDELSGARRHSRRRSHGRRAVRTQLGPTLRATPRPEPCGPRASTVRARCAVAYLRARA